MKFSRFNSLFLILISLVLFGCGKYDSVMTIASEGGDHEIYVEVAKTNEEKRAGLMNREYLDDDTGMLFIYEHESRPAMWMKNMLISLDLVFIGADGRINYIEEQVAPCYATDDRQCPIYSSPELSSWVLELPAGYVEKKGIAVGDEVRIPLGLE